jgi:hypothetical protein
VKDSSQIPVIVVVLLMFMFDWGDGIMTRATVITLIVT